MHVIFLLHIFFDYCNSHLKKIDSLSNGNAIVILLHMARHQEFYQPFLPKLHLNRPHTPGFHIQGHKSIAHQLKNVLFSTHLTFYYCLDLRRRCVCTYVVCLLNAECYEQQFPALHKLQTYHQLSDLYSPQTA